MPVTTTKKIISSTLITKTIYYYSLSKNATVIFDGFPAPQQRTLNL